MADYLSRMDFIVLDELGYLPFAQAGGQLLFHLISRLYEQTSVIVTTNLDVRRVAERRQHWTPIGGQTCEPFDSLSRWLKPLDMAGMANPHVQFHRLHPHLRPPKWPEDMQAPDFSAAPAGHASGRFVRDFLSAALTVVSKGLKGGLTRSHSVTTRKRTIKSDPTAECRRSAAPRTR